MTFAGKTALKKSFRTVSGSRISVVLPPEKPCEALPEDIPIDIVYEDDDVAVVNKPQGMVVHPAPGNPDGTLVNALLYHMKGRLSTINGVIRPALFTVSTRTPAVFWRLPKMTVRTRLLPNR